MNEFEELKLEIEELDPDLVDPDRASLDGGGTGGIVDCSLHLWW